MPTTFPPFVRSMSVAALAATLLGCSPQKIHAQASITVTTPPAADPGVTVTTPSASDPGVMMDPPAPTENDDDNRDKMREIETGVLWYPTEASTESGVIKLWVYIPKAVHNDPEKKVPCVLVAPAGTPMIWGSRLGEGAQREHLPYVRAGFCVIGYEIEGDCDADQSNEQILAAVTQFRQAHAGISDARAAISYALTMPEVDPKRIYVAGHSSAASLALLAAEYDTRVAGCMAYAPPTDLVARMGPKFINVMRQLIPDIKSFLIHSAPITGVKRLKCPLFLFHADDDSNVPLADNTAFYKRVSKFNKHVTFVRVNKGDHYVSMITQGIPRAIVWLKKQPQ